MRFRTWWWKTPELGLLPFRLFNIVNEGPGLLVDANIMFLKL